MARAAVLLLALVACGCLAHRKPTWQAPPEPFGTVSDDIIAGLIADGDKAWAGREDPKQLDEAARAWAAALRYRPADPSLLVKLGRVALRKGRHTSGPAAAGWLDEAVGYAERALTARNPALAEAARAHPRPEQVFTRASAADLPALVLYAEALLDWAAARGTPTVVDRRDWIAAAARRALAFDRAAGFGAPDRVLAILDCELPDAGQNLRDALDHFEAAVAAAPGYLPTRLAYAEEYATRMRDAARYRRLLEEVLAGDPNAIPEARAENLDAQRAARKLLRR
jgi:hypothetical protein